MAVKTIEKALSIVSAGLFLWYTKSNFYIDNTNTQCYDIDM